ncbi:Hypothetical_protein [Hexamita inflata]|uniref:Hypothetical_protein n=1 Tax=Hexamita inflata TaxID=28002 RepID=A0AA86R459_9EUKA|nr:Hypothetical protein HINF_LOCUS58896 [Hexamita inflata]
MEEFKQQASKCSANPKKFLKFQECIPLFSELIGTLPCDIPAKYSGTKKITSLVTQQYKLFVSINEIIYTQYGEQLRDIRNSFNISEDGIPTGKFLCDAKDQQFNESSITFLSLSPCYSICQCILAALDNVQCFTLEYRQSVEKYLIVAAQFINNNQISITQRQMAMNILNKIFLLREDSTFLIYDIFNKDYNGIIDQNDLIYHLLQPLFEASFTVQNSFTNQLIRIIQQAILLCPQILYCQIKNQSMSNIQISLFNSEYIYFITQLLHYDIKETSFFYMDPKFFVQSYESIKRQLNQIRDNITIAQINNNYMLICFYLMGIHKRKFSIEVETMTLIGQLMLISKDNAEKMHKMSELQIKIIQSSLCAIFSGINNVGFDPSRSEACLRGLSGLINSYSLLKYTIDEISIQSHRLADQSNADYVKQSDKYLINILRTIYSTSLQYYEKSDLYSCKSFKYLFSSIAQYYMACTQNYLPHSREIQMDVQAVMNNVMKEMNFDIARKIIKDIVNQVCDMKMLSCTKLKCQQSDISCGLIIFKCGIFSIILQFQKAYIKENRWEESLELLGVCNSILKAQLENILINSADILELVQNYLQQVLALIKLGLDLQPVEEILRLAVKFQVCQVIIIEFLFSLLIDLEKPVKLQEQVAILLLDILNSPYVDHTNCKFYSQINSKRFGDMWEHMADVCTRYKGSLVSYIFAWNASDDRLLVEQIQSIVGEKTKMVKMIASSIKYITKCLPIIKSLSQALIFDVELMQFDSITATKLIEQDSTLFVQILINQNNDNQILKQLLLYQPVSKRLLDLYIVLVNDIDYHSTALEITKIITSTYTPLSNQFINIFNTYNVPKPVRVSTSNSLDLRFHLAINSLRQFDRLCIMRLSYLYVCLFSLDIDNQSVTLTTKTQNLTFNLDQFPFNITLQINKNGVNVNGTSLTEDLSYLFVPDLHVQMFTGKAFELTTARCLLETQTTQCEIIKIADSKILGGVPYQLKDIYKQVNLTLLFDQVRLRFAQPEYQKLILILALETNNDEDIWSSFDCSLIDLEGLSQFICNLLKMQRTSGLLSAGRQLVKAAKLSGKDVKDITKYFEDI